LLRAAIQPKIVGFVTQKGEARFLDMLLNQFACFMATKQSNKSIKSTAPLQSNFIEVVAALRGGLSSFY